MQQPNVRGFFDHATATWSYVVWLEGHEDRRCAIIDSVLDYDPLPAVQRPLLPTALSVS